MSECSGEDFNPDEMPPLYNDCVEIPLCFGDVMYFYAPKNDLDNELFKELISSLILATIYGLNLSVGLLLLNLYSTSTSG